MDKERLVILKSEIETQMREIEKIYSKIREREKAKGEFALESLAYQLHNLYCAYEDLFKIVANTFENKIEGEAKFHLELLKRMILSIQGVRPYLISEETFRLLNNLRSFRHFYRHAYSYELDERKVKIVLEDAYRVSELFKKDIKTFLEKL